MISSMIYRAVAEGLGLNPDDPRHDDDDLEMVLSNRAHIRFTLDPETGEPDAVIVPEGGDAP